MARSDAVESLRRRIRERFNVAWPYNRVQTLLAATKDEDEALRAIERANRVKRRLDK
jgi:hypothetical protein